MTRPHLVKQIPTPKNYYGLYARWRDKIRTGLGWPFSAESVTFKVRVQSHTLVDGKSPVLSEIEAWCLETFGGDVRRWDVLTWSEDNRHFVFRYEKDALHFKLRWMG